MKQVAQRSRDGRIVVVDTPTPSVRPGRVLVSNVCSVISAGTERGKLELGALNIVQKARARPDLTKKVLERARAEGVRSTVTAVRERLDALGSLGYSSAGRVLEVGPGVEGLAPGDQVACAGGGWANHAEVVVVPKNLVARMPPEVSFEEAAYGTLGAIALHGVRQSEAAVGERIGVIGLGLVGQLAVRILSAAGCRVVAIDLDRTAVDLSNGNGVTPLLRDDPRLSATVSDVTDGLGLDAVVICAAAASPDPLDLAARLARDRGRLVVVGDVRIDVDRGLLYGKELELRLSRSYGPGRYDREYEEGGRDLPPGYVRWTEQRNLKAFLDLVASRRVVPSELTTHRFPVERAAEAYAALKESDSRAFGVLLEYPRPPDEIATRVSKPPSSVRARAGSQARVGVIGAGSFARRVLLPALRSQGAGLVAVASEQGLSAADVLSRYGFERASTPEELCLADDIDAVVIATRHSSHSRLVALALNAGKAVFVEKPLALDWEQLAEVEDALGPSSFLVVGFNRRFAPFTERLRVAFAGTSDKVLVVRVNAGRLPEDHWLNDPEEGGGRLRGEGCHFVDLVSHLAGSPVESVQGCAAPGANLASDLAQSWVATLRCTTGALATIVYAGDGDTRLAKERIEVYGGGMAGVLDDFRRLDLYEGGKKTSSKGNGDKGHRAQVDHFLKALRGEGDVPLPDSYLASTRATLALADAVRIGRPVGVD
jgi:predicted dehydrogenase/threonine dehydrogenase-like Zn-dependent dehydrogenase